MIHPLFAWLTGRRLRQADRAAWAGLIGGLAVLAVCGWAWVEAQVAALEALLLAALVMLLTPPVVAALSGVLTALELGGEQFQFLLLTNLPELVMVRGLLYAAQYRTRYFRAVAAAMIPALVIGLLVEYLQIVASVLRFLAPTPTPPPDATVPGALLAVLVVLLWGMNLLAARLGTAVGLRWPNVALAAALSAVIMLLVTAAPLLVLVNLAWGPLCFLGAVYICFHMTRYLLGDRLLRDAAYWVRRT